MLKLVVQPTDQIGAGMPHSLRRIWNPAIYQGRRTNRSYFEGWYFKQTDARGQFTFAVIPGVSHSAHEALSHAFIHVITNEGYSHYFTYPLEDFYVDTNERFNVWIGGSLFTEQGMSLRLDDGDAHVSGDFAFGSWVPWPVTALSPGIMGWYRFVPGMECYHGVLSMDHSITGTLNINDKTVRMDGGRGYSEKDWGRSFPSSWIWAQSNHFDIPATSLTASLAKIPWMGASFTGSIVGFLLDGQLHRFTTYTGAKLVSLTSTAQTAHFVLRDAREEIEVTLRGSAAQSLKAPMLGAMSGHAAESLGGTIEVALRSLRGARPGLLFEGTGRLAGIEIMNNSNELTGGSHDAC